MIACAEDDQIGATAAKLYDLLNCPKAFRRFSAAEGQVRTASRGLARCSTNMSSTGWTRRSLVQRNGASASAYQREVRSSLMSDSRPNSSRFSGYSALQVPHGLPRLAETSPAMAVPIPVSSWRLARSPQRSSAAASG